MLINALNYSLHAANSAYKFKPVINYNQVRYSLIEQSSHIANAITK